MQQNQKTCVFKAEKSPFDSLTLERNSSDVLENSQDRILLISISSDAKWGQRNLLFRMGGQLNWDTIYENSLGRKVTSNWHAVSGNLPIFVSTLNSILALLPLIVIASPFSSRPFTVLILLKFSPRSHDKHHWCPLQARNLRLRGAREGWRSCSQFCLSREGVQSEWGRRRPSCKMGEEATSEALLPVFTPLQGQGISHQTRVTLKRSVLEMGQGALPDFWLVVWSRPASLSHTLESTLYCLLPTKCFMKAWKLPATHRTFFIVIL